MKEFNFGIKDEEFIRGKAPMTKEEVRVLSLGKLKLSRNSIVLDIGAGTGSVSIEAALFSHDGKVFSIEKKKDAYDLFLQNIEKFEVKNIIPIHGDAPAMIPNEKFDGIFVGGSGGNIKEIVDLSYNLLGSGKRIVMNFITIENTYKALEALREHGKFTYEIISVNISKGREISGLTLMEAHNPVYIITGIKED